MKGKKYVGIGIVCLLMMVSLPTVVGVEDEIEFPEEGGPYKLTVLFCELGSCALFNPLLLMPGAFIFYPLIIFWDNSFSMNFNCIHDEVAFVNGVNINDYLDESISRRVEGHGFKGFQIYPFIALGMCTYIDIK